MVIKRFIKNPKLLTNAIFRKYFEIRTGIEYNCNNERFGSQYGGWDVAVDYIDDKSIIYSFGIGEDASFDVALIAKYNNKIFAFDPTPKSIAWVKKQSLSENFVFYDYGIANFDGDIAFNPPDNPNHVSHTILEKPNTQSKPIIVAVKRLQSIMEELGHKQIDLLKMDIEGAEYMVIDDMIASNILPKQILAEFHHRFPNVGIDKTRKIIGNLRDVGYRIFSISNNYEEFGFIHESIIK